MIKTDNKINKQKVFLKLGLLNISPLAPKGPLSKTREKTSCWGRGWGSGNGHSTPRSQSSYGRSRAEVDLFASWETTHCPLVLNVKPNTSWAGRYSTGVAEATAVHISPDCTAPGSSGVSLLGRSPSAISSPVLAGPSMVLGPAISPRRVSMEIPIRKNLLSLKWAV